MVVEELLLLLFWFQQVFFFFLFQVEVDADSELSAASKASFLDKVRQSNAACQAGDFETAVKLYGEAITLDPCNHILFSNRSAALVKLGQFARALQDASRAVELNAKWPKVVFCCPFFLLLFGGGGDSEKRTRTGQEVLICILSSGRVEQLGSPVERNKFSGAILAGQPGRADNG